MDRTEIANLAADRVVEAMGSSAFTGLWNRLVKHAGEDAADVLKLVCQLTPPKRIAELHHLEAKQCERGAGFLGMLPDQVPADLGVPDALDASLGVALQRGAPAFTERGLDLLGDESLVLSSELAVHIARLLSVVEPST